MTGDELYKLLNSPPERGAVYGRVDYFIRDTYAVELNNGVVPDWRTVYRLEQLLKKYMNGHKSEWGQPAELIIINGLKEAPSQISKERAYWEKAIKAAGEYFGNPSPENAEELFLALPENTNKIDDFLDAEGEEMILNYIVDFSAGGGRRHLSIIEKAIKAGEPHAVDVAFRLFSISDGAYTESLCFILGELLIPNHPRLFLQRAFIHQEDVGWKKFNDHIECILQMATEWGEIPEAGGDQAKYKQIYNDRIARRIKALESVDDPGLQDIRNQCLEILRKAFLVTN
jgi:hypothetical protein